MAIQRRSPSRSLMTWDPFREMEEMMSDFFGSPSFRRISPYGQGWMPAIDMYETDDRFVIKAELPGMEKSDIDISVTDHQLTLKGERKVEEESKGENYYLSERSYGRFFRSIPLPSNADANKIEATFKDGVLEINIPKIPESQAKKVEIGGKAQQEKKATY